MIFKTFDSDIDKWTAKIGVFGKSFNELGNAVNDAFTSVIDNLDNLDEDVGFWESLKSNLSSKKDWIKNSSGEIVSRENIDSYIPELDIDSAQNKLQNIFTWEDTIKNGDATWQDYFETCKGGKEYIVDLIKNTDDLSKLTGKDLVQANQEARKSTIDHNHALKQQTLGAKAASLGMSALATAGNIVADMFLSMAISGVIELFTSLEQKEERAAEKAAGMASSLNEFHSSFSDGSDRIAELSAKYDELSEGVSAMGANVSLTDGQYAEYKNTVNELSELMPTLTTLFNEQGEKIGFTGGKLKDATKEYQKYIQTQAQSFLTSGDKDGNSFQDSLDDFKYSNETHTYGWSNIWRDSVNYLSKFLLPPQYSVGELLFSGGRHSDLGSEIFGATEEYSTHEQLDMLQQLVNTKKEDWSDILHDVSTGDSKEANLVEELLDIDVDKVSTMYDGEYDQLQRKLSQKITGLQRELEGKAGSITLGMQTALVADDDYWTLAEDTKNAVSSIISRLDYDALTNLDIDLNEQLAVETWVAGLVDDVKANENGVTDAILGLFKLDTDVLSPSEAKTLADNYITAIANAMYNGSATAEQKEALKKSFGFENVDSNYDDFQKTLLNDFGEKETITGNNFIPGGSIHYDISEVYDLQRTQNLNNWASEQKVTQEELEGLKEKGYGAKTSIEELTHALKELRSQKTDSNKTSLSFDNVWDSIGSSGDEKADKEALEAKEKLLELAEAGKLTEEEFKNSSLADTFTNAGVSIEEATKKVNALVESSKQLAAMGAGMKAITSAYDEKKDSGDNTVSSSTLGSMYDTLGVESWSSKDKGVWENYKSVAGDGKKSLSDLKDAQDKLTASFIHSNNFLSQLTSANQDYYISTLKNMGVENARAVVMQTLIANEDEATANKINTILESLNLAGATDAEIISLSNELTALYSSSEALGQYVLKKQLANGDALSTSESIDNLINLAKQCGYTGSAIETLTTMQKNQKKIENLDPNNKKDAQEINELENTNANLNKKLTKEIGKGFKVKPMTTSNSPSSPKSPSGKTSTKAEKEEINWLERRLTSMQNIIDLTASKLQNLFSVKAKNKNLKDQIKQSTKLMNEYGVAAAAYQRKANQGKKVLSKEIISNVESGKITKKSNLFAKYSQKDYKKINSYIDNYDKAQNARKNRAEQKAKIRELKKDQYQNHVDSASSRISKLELKKENADTARVKNIYLDRELKQYQKSYKYQIAIAKLTKDTTEQARLRAEYESKITALKKEQLQNTLDENSDKNELLDARLSNAFTVEDKNRILDDEIGIVHSDKAAYEKNYDDADSNHKEQSLLASKAVKSDKSKDLKKADKEKIKSYIAKNKPVPDKLLNKCSPKTQEQLARYNASLDWVDEALKDKTLNEEQSETKERELKIQQYQNNADQYQADLDLSSAEKANMKTSAEKNQAVDREIDLTSKLYAEKIQIAKLEQNQTAKAQLEAELAGQMVAYEKEKLDNIVQYYANLRKVTDSRAAELSNAADELEARGLIASSNLYSSQIALNDEKRKGYEEELAQLIEQHAKIEEGTQEWYDSLDSIQACKDGIASCTKNAIDLGTAIRNIDWKILDKSFSRFDLISSEYDLLIKRMSGYKLIDDKTGSFTKEGTATLGAYYAQLELSRTKSDQHKNTLDTMWQHIQNGDEGYTDQNALDQYYEEYQEYVNLKSEEMDIEQKLIDFMKDKYSTELDLLQDIVNKRKDLLQAEKDEYDYRRTIEEKTKNIGTLSKQIEALSGDDSEATKAKIQQLQVSLDDAQRDLQDTEYDKWVSDQQEMLDNLYNEFHDFIDDKMNDRDALLNEAVTYLNGGNIGAEVAKILDEYADSLNYTPTEDFATINAALGQGGAIVGAINTVAESINSYFKTMQENQTAANELVADISSVENINDYETYQKAKNVIASYENAPDAVKNLVDSGSKSSIDATASQVAWIEEQAGHATNAINAIGTVTSNSGQVIAQANQWYNGLNAASRQIVDNSGLNHILHQANVDYADIQERNNRLRNNLDYYIKSTYGKSAQDYACNIKNATEAQINIANKIRERGLNRGDGFNSPNQAAISQIIAWINSSGEGISLRNSEEDLWMYMQNIGYADGGIAGALQTVPGMNGDSGWVTLKKGEAVLTPEQTRDFQKLAQNLNVLNLSTDILQAMSGPALNAAPTPANGTTIGDVYLNVDLPNVTNYEEFKQKMQSDPKIEQMFKSMIWDKNSLSKYSIRL